MMLHHQADEEPATIDQRESDHIVTFEVTQDGRLLELITLPTDERDEVRMQFCRLILHHGVRASITHFLK